jgi:hypothetical protein
MSSERSFLGKDGWAGLVVLIFSLVLFLLTIGLPDMPLVPVGPGFYPRIVLGLTAFLGLWLLIADYRLQQRHGAQARLSTFRWISILSPYKAVVMHFALFAVTLRRWRPLDFDFQALPMWRHRAVCWIRPNRRRLGFACLCLQA